ncbi:MAG TPA: hypothetical protein VGL61_08090 [Kofleriaceae bacterium]|jgi:hypothetical protein
MVEVFDDAELVWRARPGTPPRWLPIAVVLACFATIAIPAMGCRALWEQVVGGLPIGQTLFENGLAMLAAVAIAAIVCSQFGVAISLHVAVLLPIVHVVAIAIAWPMWLACGRHFADYADYLQIAAATPLSAVVLAIAAIGFAVARFAVRGRRDAHVTHAFALFGLVLLLALGLWLPLACWVANLGARAAGDAWLVMQLPRQLAILALVPPVVAATAYTLLAFRAPACVARNRFPIVFSTLLVLAVAVGVRAETTVSQALVYGNFVPVLLGAALVACSGLALLVLATAGRDRASRDKLAASGVHGQIVSDDADPVVGALEIASWLRAPRLIVRSFVLATPSGNLPIAGARIVATMAQATTVLRVGEAVPVLRAGDAVIVGGLERGDDGAPFRSLAGPIAGADVVVARADVPPPSFADVALATWRPAIAYLAILVAVALPALAATLATLGS